MFIVFQVLSGLRDADGRRYLLMCLYSFTKYLENLEMKVGAENSLATVTEQLEAC